MSDDVVELGVHKPTPQSVITRLHRDMDNIKGIIVWTIYEDGSNKVSFSTMPSNELAYGARCVGFDIDKVLFDEEGV